MTAPLEVVPIIAPDHACAVAGLDIDEALHDGALLGRSLAAAHERYGHDLVIVFVDVSLEAEAAGAVLGFEDGGTHVETPVGFGRADWTYDPGRKRLPVLFEAIRRCRASLPPTVPVAGSLKGPFSLAAIALGMENFLESLVSNPEAAKRELEGAAAFQAAHALQIARAGAIPWFGDPLASADMLGDRWFRDFALDPLSCAIRAARSAAGVAALHVCGDPLPIAASAAESGADWLSFELRDPVAVRARAEGPVLFGGVPTGVLAEGNPEAIRERCAAMARSLPDRCVAATDCDVPAGAPEENVAAMVSGCREGFLNRGSGHA